MKDRYDTLKAVALVLRGMDKISEELGKSGTLLGSLQFEWKNLETKYQELMDRLADLPYDGPGQRRIDRVSRRNLPPDNSPNADEQLPRGSQGNLQKPPHGHSGYERNSGESWTGKGSAGLGCAGGSLTENLKPPEGSQRE